MLCYWNAVKKQENSKVKHNNAMMCIIRRMSMFLYVMIQLEIKLQVVTLLPFCDKSSFARFEIINGNCVIYLFIYLCYLFIYLFIYVEKFHIEANHLVQKPFGAFFNLIVKLDRSRSQVDNSI